MKAIKMKSYVVLVVACAMLVSMTTAAPPRRGRSQRSEHPEVANRPPPPADVSGEPLPPPGNASDHPYPPLGDGNFTGTPLPKPTNHPAEEGEVRRPGPHGKQAQALWRARRQGDKPGPKSPRPTDASGNTLPPPTRGNFSGTHQPRPTDQPPQGNGTRQPGPIGKPRADKSGSELPPPTDASGNTLPPPTRGDFTGTHQPKPTAQPNQENGIRQSKPTGLPPAHRNRASRDAKPKPGDKGAKPPTPGDKGAKPAAPGDKAAKPAPPTGVPPINKPPKGGQGSAFNVSDAVTSRWVELVLVEERPAGGKGGRSGEDEGEGEDVGQDLLGLLPQEVPVEFRGLSSTTLRAAVLSVGRGKQGKPPGAVLYDFSSEPALVVIRGHDSCFLWSSASVTFDDVATTMADRNGTVNATFARTNVTLNVTGPVTSEGAASKSSNVTALFCGPAPIYTTQVVENGPGTTPAPDVSTAAPVPRERRELALTLNERVTILGVPRPPKVNKGRGGHH